MESLIEGCFWGSLLLIAYSYVLYPILIWLAALAWGRADAPQELSEESLPSISLVIAAYNEEESIGDRIVNALEAEYPADKIEVLIGSDGSSDGTNNIVNNFKDPRVRLLDFSDRSGKASVLNRTIPQAVGEVIVFSDANTFFEPIAIRNLIATLLRPGVIASCGRLQLTDTQHGGNVDGLYWRYETVIKRAEGRLGAVLGANGAIYALRKSDYVALPPGTIIDDFVGPLLAKVQHGGNIAYQPNAIATEETAPVIQSEFIRRVRIGSGNFQSISNLWPLIAPKYGWTSLAFISHKLLRWCVPLLMIIALIANVFLASKSYYNITFFCQILFYIASILGAYITGGGKLGKLLRVTTMFTYMNIALAVGFWRWLRGNHSGTWRRTARSQTAASQKNNT